MLGHKNAAMTLDTYADLFDTDLDDVATSISNKIAAIETLQADQALVRTPVVSGNHYE